MIFAKKSVSFWTWRSLRVFLCLCFQSVCACVCVREFSPFRPWPSPWPLGSFSLFLNKVGKCVCVCVCQGRLFTNITSQHIWAPSTSSRSQFVRPQQSVVFLMISLTALIWSTLLTCLLLSQQNLTNVEISLASLLLIVRHPISQFCVSLSVSLRANYVHKQILIDDVAEGVSRRSWSTLSKGRCLIHLKRRQYSGKQYWDFFAVTLSP